MNNQTQQDTLAVGKKLVDFCKQNKVVEAVKTLYAENIESQEAAETPDMPAYASGIDNALKKNKQWEETMEVHSAQVDGPYPLGDRFAIHFKYDATDKRTSKNWQMQEVGVYTVKDGKIVKEEFFYTM
ncbi:nuclear transport factor 2 family protein [Bdellovibrio sp. SKB1291214]|uniref:nuclear transport factor 2 family protein n=1 Tax=Bdellovibrio sp. SKB1291214 TaxID=1732569 RepID=UPI000B519DA7|nr:nuclear transport factor 2 family protein [Bdellovibrio sp. SKB1291214]UYL09300.1 nuclear transport factor 2 family protein [Bdellovibrio sp. SKB1291214]